MEINDSNCLWSASFLGCGGLVSGKLQAGPHPDLTPPHPPRNRN
jgi:hypothetical protein